MLERLVVGLVLLALGTGRRSDTSLLALHVGGATTTFLDFIELLAHSCFRFLTMSAISAPKMRGWPARINTFLPVFTALGLAAALSGCASDPDKKKEPKKDKEVAALRIHVEQRENGEGGKEVSVLRASPVTFKIEKEPFLDERDLKSAKLEETFTGFAITLRTTLHGRLLLEMNSVSRLGRHLAIVSTWEVGKDKTETRWIAAPQLKAALRDGTLTFVADCTREEAEHIVRGINNVAIKLENQPKPEKPKKDKPSTDDANPDAAKPYQEPR